MNRTVEIVGILNVTPDSFSDGGRFNRLEKAVKQAKAMVAQGATVIDIGGESTHPGFTPVTADEEMERVIPVIQALKKWKPDLCLSIDTQKAYVAVVALQEGVDWINDIWGLQGDSEMVKVAASFSGKLILMHNRRSADPSVDILADEIAFFKRSLAICAEHRIDPARLILDPGIGFGKTQPQNYEVLRRLSELSVFGLPLLLGTSRKSFIGAADGSRLSPTGTGRLGGTVATTLWGLTHQVRFFRVHDVAENLQAIRIYQTIERGLQEPQ